MIKIPISYNATFSPFQGFSRKEWSLLEEHPNFPFSDINLSKLKALNEPLTEKEIMDIYLPLCRLLQIHITHYRNLHSESDYFFKRKSKRIPFIIGIAGSVAVGKSTTARVLQKLLSMNSMTPKVDLITTDGYLYPNEILEEKGILDKKGFPESYDAIQLLNFLSGVKSGRRALKSPLYSHLYYNVIPDEFQIIDSPDILIVEGINVLQDSSLKKQKKRKIFVSDFFDFSIYVDASERDLKEWYVQRFLKLQETAFQNPESFFYKYSSMSREASIQIAEDIWEQINKPNLEMNILPTRCRADLILEKGENHFVRGVRLRKV